MVSAQASDDLGPPDGRPALDPRPGPRRAPCLGCGSSLELHQPDGDAPQRLLGTCDRCGGWHLIDCDGSVVVLLPDVTEICDTGAACKGDESDNFVIHMRSLILLLQLIYTCC